MESSTVYLVQQPIKMRIEGGSAWETLTVWARRSDAEREVVRLAPYGAVRIQPAPLKGASLVLVDDDR